MSTSTSFVVPKSVLERCSRLHNWNNTKAVHEAYLQFMELKVQMQDWNAKLLSPPLLVDLMWHQHMLDPQSYWKACMDYCGRLIGHDPDGGLDTAARNKRMDSTLVAVKARFGSDYNASLWTFHHNQDSRNNDSHEENSNDSNNGRNDTYRSPDHSRNVRPRVDRAKEKITIRIRYQTGEETLYKVGKSTRMSKLFIAYAARKGKFQTSFRFLLHGEKIGPQETPMKLGLEDQGQIDCILEARGS